MIDSSKAIRITPSRDRLAAWRGLWGVAMVVVGITGCANNGRPTLESVFGGIELPGRGTTEQRSGETTSDEVESSEAWDEPISMRDAFDELDRYSLATPSHPHEGQFEPASTRMSVGPTAPSVEKSPITSRQWSADKAILSAK